MITVNIASHLPAMAASQPDTLAVALQSGAPGASTCSYRELDEASNIIARGLQEAGIVKGTRTVLMVQPGLDFFTLVFALFKLGAVLVAIDPGMGRSNLGKCLQEAEPEAFIGVRKAHLARILLGWGRSTLRTNIVVEPWPLLGLLMNDMHKLRRAGELSSVAAMNTVYAEDSAAILFTSGSTGVPKGVNYTHGNFTAQVRALQNLYNIQPGEIDLATFPLFALFAPAMGMTSIIPDMDFTRPGTVDPEGIYKAVTGFGATTMFGSPALLKRVGKWGVESGKRLPTLKRVISAGAPVAADIIQRFSHLLDDDCEIFTPYGATESLPVSSIGSKEILGETGRQSAEGRGVCVGRPVANTTVNIIAITDDPIREWKSVELMQSGMVGEIVVRGPQVTASYYNRDESNELAKIKASDGFYHRMGDLGYLDEQGRLWFCGRKSERVILDDATLFTVCCEGVFNAHKRIMRSALVGVVKDGKATPVLCLELEADSQHTAVNVLQQELLDLGSKFAHTSGIKHFLVHPAFPVDIRHNAKIGRPQLAEWAQEQF